MSDLQKGYSFSGASPNNLVTAEKLNTLVDGASIQPGFYLEKPELFGAEPDDVLLVYDTSAGGYRKVAKQNLIATATAHSGWVNLQVNCTGPALVSMKADELVLRNDAGGARYLKGVELTADVTLYASGATAGGRDFASVLPNSWLYVWVISNGLLDRVLLSQSATAPTLPVATPPYQYKVLLGAVRAAAGILMPSAVGGCC